jgi:hypothetical protein
MKAPMVDVMPIALAPARPGSLTAMMSALALLLLSLSTAVYAEAVVKGSIDAVEVDARDSSIAEVLTALGQPFGLRYRTSTDLYRPVTGSFKGPLLKVISRLLKDYDYVVRSSVSDRIDVTVIKFRLQDSGSVIPARASPYPSSLFPPNPPSAPSPAPNSGRSTGADPYPPALFPPTPPSAPTPAPASGEVTSAGANAYPPALFPLTPPSVPSPAPASGEVASAWSDAYPAALFPKIPPTAQRP